MTREYLIVENPPADLWKSFLEMFPDGNFEQCFEYGEISELAFPSSKVVRFAITYAGKLVGMVQGTYSSYFGFGMTLGVMRGPVVKTKNEESLRLVGNLLEALEDYGRKNRIIQARVLVPEAWQMREVFSTLGYVTAGKLNEYVVNLDKGENELWGNIAHNKRRNIKKALKEGVEVVHSRNHEDLLTFYSMLKVSMERGGFSSYPFSWFEAVWKIYKPELSKVFLARWKGKDISGVFVVIHGKTVYALAAGSFSEGWKVRPNDLMHWKIMEWACQNGYSKYHMGLVSNPPPAEGSSAWGIWRWKREWKGNLKAILVLNKTYLRRYGLMLKMKRLAEWCYTRFRQLT